jgi:hypothetical protein
VSLVEVIFVIEAELKEQLLNLFAQKMENTAVLAANAKI